MDAREQRQMKNKHVGSTFDSFLEAEGIAADVNAAAVKKTFLYQLEQQMKRAGLPKNVIRKALKSPTTTQRVFSLNTGVSLETMVRAAHAVGAKLEVNVVPRAK